MQWFVGPEIWLELEQLFVVDAGMLGQVLKVVRWQVHWLS